jgi:DNA-binding NarL/FixJ family response regulator
MTLWAKPTSSLQAYNEFNRLTKRATVGAAFVLEDFRQRILTPVALRGAQGVSWRKDLPGPKSPMQRARVLIADEQRLFLDGMHHILAPDYEMVGALGDGRMLLSEAERLRPDVIILEVALPLLNGLEVARRLRDLLPRTKVVFVSTQSDVGCIEEAYRAGAVGYVLKTSPASVLQKAIRDVLEGQIAFPMKKPAGSWRTAKSPKSPSDLTRREREVLQLLAEGYSASQIAELLKMSLKTVAFHKTNIKQKLDVWSTAELTKCALKLRVTS